MKNRASHLLFFSIIAGPLAFAAQMPRIDAHVHVFQAPPEYIRMLNRMDLRVLNIAVVDKHDRGFEEAEPQQRMIHEVFQKTAGRAAWCSTFDPWNFRKADFVKNSEAELAMTFREGAVAVKIYKDMGMELKSADGKYLMPDDPVFRPILDFVAEKGKTLIAHIAEPWAAWRPLDPASPHYGYYKANPDWHMYRHPERPSKETILAARDHMLKQHPNLRVVGAHLGSMEDDVDQIAKRFDAYPNFAVDTAARVPDLMLQPRDKVRVFLIKYQDRVLYGTDLSLMPWEKDITKAIRHMEDEYARDWTYFATGNTVTYNGKQIQGLALPEPVLRKLFHDNAVRWVPGIVGSRARVLN